MVHCVVTRGAGRGTRRALERQFRDDPDVTLVIDRRSAERIGNVAGTQAPVGAYAIVDGDNDNKDQLGQGDGYFGVSNYETSWPPTPPQPGCGGDGADHAGNSNSGGCVGLDAVPVPVPGVPIACGNTSGHTWSATTRDGCSIP